MDSLLSYNHVNKDVTVNLWMVIFFSQIFQAYPLLFESFNVKFGDEKTAPYLHKF